MILDRVLLNVHSVVEGLVYLFFEKEGDGKGETGASLEPPIGKGTAFNPSFLNFEQTEKEIYTDTTQPLDL